MARASDGKEMVRTKLQSDPVDWACPSCGANPGQPCEGLRIGYTHQERAYIMVEKHRTDANAKHR